MEAPEKLYISYMGYGCFNDDGSTTKVNESQTEYTRTDAFIEKALKFLDEKFYFNNLHYGIESGVFDSEEEMFEDFKNYMKGE